MLSSLGQGSRTLLRRQHRVFSSLVDAPTSSVRHAIPEENLRAHLERNGILEVGKNFTTSQFLHGQSNPTYTLSVDGLPRFVVRRQPPGDLLPGAHRVDREFRVMNALGKAGSTAPVPRTRLYSDDVSLVGTPFFVYDFVPGQFHPDPTLPHAKSPRERRALYNGMADAIARVHAADVDRIGLSDFGKHEAYVQRQIKTWSRAYTASETTQISSMDTLIEKMPSLDPTQDRAATKVFVTHGDLRLDNMIFEDEPLSSSSSIRSVAGILDWELSTLADTPQLDLAYACMVFHLPRVEGCSYTGVKGLEIIKDTKGLPTEQEFIDSYLSSLQRHYAATVPYSSSITDDQVAIFEMSQHKYFLALAFFKAAAIGQGVYKRGLEGNASAPNAGVFGESAKMCADIALNFLVEYEQESGL